ncbi:hypothetical protein ANCDUO_00327 [Ancylostoma duodenale]|uniref:Uncharacterized protein n=1 Tax=Ancylostoma duodenale TaxID=51022 RepID=A0A0C2E1S6_9BILA|nr:hypothetical protein ANCDUO_00327 [Ancylostoma duodenale]
MSGYDEGEIEAFYMDLEKFYGNITRSIRRLLRMYSCQQHRRGVRSACSASPRQRRKNRGFKSYQETIVSRYARATTVEPAELQATIN